MHFTHGRHAIVMNIDSLNIDPCPDAIIFQQTILFSKYFGIPVKKTTGFDSFVLLPAVHLRCIQMSIDVALEGYGIFSAIFHLSVFHPIYPKTHFRSVQWRLLYNGYGDLFLFR